MYPMMMYGGFGMFGFVLHAIGWVLGILLIVFIVRAIIRNSHQGWSHMADHSLSILRERYAKGEITKEQFESMKKELGHQ